jgi:hypothetical protein
VEFILKHLSSYARPGEVASARLDPLYSPWRVWETLIIHGQKGQVEQKKGLYGHKPDRVGVLGLREDKGEKKNGLKTLTDCWLITSRN